MSPSIAVKLMIYWVSQFWNVFLWFRNAWGLGYNKSKHEKAIVEIAPMHQRWVNSRRTYSGKLKNSYNSSNKIMTIVYCGNVTNDSNFGLLSISTLSSFFCMLNQHCWSKLSLNFLTIFVVGDIVELKLENRCIV